MNRKDETGAVMTTDAIPSTQNQWGIRFPQLPDRLIVLHAIIMTCAGIAWARNAAEMGRRMASPGAHFWYGLTRLECFPVSDLCRLLTEFLVVQLRNWTHLSMPSAISMVYWVLLFVLGTVQWYLVGKLVAWIGSRDEAYV
jgi:hypothetical protein